MANFNDILGSLDDQEKQKRKQQDKSAQLDAVTQSGSKIEGAVNKNTESITKGLKDVKGEVKVSNPDLAKSADFNQVVDSINKMNVTTFMSTHGFHDMAENITRLTDEVQTLQKRFEDQGLTSMSDTFKALVGRLEATSKSLTGTKVSVDSSIMKSIDGLKKSIDAIEFNPSVNVAAPDTKVVTTPVDLKPVISELGNVVQAIKDSEKETEDIDLSPVTNGLASVQKAITSLRFPVSNYVLPFADNTGKAVQMKLNSDGSLPTQAVSGTSSAGATGSAVPANASYQGLLAQTALPTAGSAGNLVGALSDKFGREVVITNAMRDIVGSQFTTITSSTAETTIVTAVANTFIDVTAIILINTSATATRVDIRDTTAGSVLKAFYLPAADTRGVSFNTPWPQTSVNTNWTATCGTSVADVRICVQYIRNK